MRRMSAKRRQEVEAVRESRSEFTFEIWSCMVCGDEWRTKGYPRVLDVHEIARGGSRSKAFQDRRAWLLLCREHHDEVGDLQLWPIAKQYALKSLHDPEHYDRVWLNHCRGRADDAITDEEVDEFIRELE